MGGVDSLALVAPMFFRQVSIVLRMLASWVLNTAVEWLREGAGEAVKPAAAVGPTDGGEEEAEATDVDPPVGWEDDVPAAAAADGATAAAAVGA